LNNCVDTLLLIHRWFLFAHLLNKGVPAWVSGFRPLLDLVDDIDKIQTYAFRKTVVDVNDPELYECRPMNVGELERMMGCITGYVQQPGT
jgi:hypothetical protein